MTRVLVALGSNLGDRAALLAAAVGRLSQIPDAGLLKQSRWRETKPVGAGREQMPYLNGAVLLEVSLTPQQLLACCQQIEDELGRRREEQWGARTVDLDILLFGHERLETPELVVPHPRMALRRFVLEPAAEIAPDMLHPAIGWTVAELLEHLDRAAPYLALAGPPGFPRRELLEAVVARPPVRLLVAGAERELQALGEAMSAGRGHQAAIELLGRWERQLDRAAWHGPSTSGQDAAQPARPTWTASDFWFDEALALAAVALAPEQLPGFHVRWLEAREKTVPPKLIVWVEAEPAPTPGSGGPADALSAELFCRAIVDRLEQPGHAPVLRVQAADRQRAVAEIAAAMAGME